MKKFIILCVLSMGILGATTPSFAQAPAPVKQEDKAGKKDAKMNKKESKGKPAKGAKKGAKADKKEVKGK